jgi:ABC-type amino acid transport substrate-binding protein
MKTVRSVALAWALACAITAALYAQQLKLNLDHLAAKASDSVDISLNNSMLQFAAKFLDGKDPDEAAVKKLIIGIDGIYVRSFEFKQDGTWTQADMDQLRNQMKTPDWSRIVGVKSAEDGENMEVHVCNQNGKVTGVVILVSGPKEFTVANIVGNVSLDSLADLGGHFGLPKMEQKKKK